MKPLVIALPGNHALGKALAERLQGDLAKAAIRRFPDGETYVRIEADCVGRDAILAATLHRPDDKILPVIFAAETLRDLGAKQITLVAPYLAYMRQDRQFQRGEGVTSRYFANLLSRCLDGLITVDPHLHRYPSLHDVYWVPSVVAHAAPLVAAWIRESVAKPLLIGPDIDSEQWVSAIAAQANVPYMILRKIRRGDAAVEVSVPETGPWRTHTPVLVDDIISTARTMIETMAQLQRAGMAPPVCIGVHGVFAKGAYKALSDAGAAQIVTSNSIPHASNRIDLLPLLEAAWRSFKETRAAAPRS